MPPFFVLQKFRKMEKHVLEMGVKCTLYVL